MKTYRITRIAIPALALIAWLLTPQTAHCFYSASTGRWSNRDPVGEPGFDANRSRPTNVLKSGPNQYLFLVNDPLDHLDPDGLYTRVSTKVWITADPYTVDSLACSAMCRMLGLAWGNFFTPERLSSYGRKQQPS